MNLPHSVLFAFVGLGLFFVPAWDPEDFTRLAGDGTCASALWLGVVGFVMHAVGAGWLLGDQLRRLRVAVETFDPVLPFLDPAEVRWCLPASFFALRDEEAALAFAPA